MTVLPVSSIIFLLTSLLLAYFCYARFLETRRDKNNAVNFHYYLASLYVFIALFLYGISGLLLESNFSLARVGTVTAVLLNALGFCHFFLIPAYSWFSLRGYVIARHILYLFILLLAGILVVDPAHSYTDAWGIIHWGFPFLVGFLAALQMNLAFACNLILLGGHFSRLKRLSLLSVLALIITFILTGFAGTYQYMGDSPFLLALSGVLLFLGVGAVFFSTVSKKFARKS